MAVADPIRFGVVGTGMMGCEHIRNVVALPDADLVAAVEPSLRSREWAIDAADDPELPFFDDVAAMLDATSPDAVVVATPNHTHREVLEPLWGSGVALMVEKPLCTTVADCVAVRDAAAEHPGLVWMGLEYRYMPAVARFVSELAGGAAGDLRMLAIREHRFPFLVKVGNWNRFTRNTGGTLVEKCCHFFDLMNVVLECRPTRVLASGAQDVNHLDESYDGERPDILDNAYVIVDFESGARALLDLCMFAEGSRFEQELVAVGDAGKVEAHVPGFVEVSRGRESELVVGRRSDWTADVVAVADDERIRHHGGHHGASYLELLAMCEAIRTGAEPAVTVEDGLWSVAVGVAAHRSIDEGRPVTLAEVGLD